MNTKPKIPGEVIFTEEQIKKRILEISRAINRDYKGEELVIIGVLKGSVYFVTDLTRHLTMPVNIDFLSIGLAPEPSGFGKSIRIKKDVDLDLKGRHVLLVEEGISDCLRLDPTGCGPAGNRGCCIGNCPGNCSGGPGWDCRGGLSAGGYSH